MANQHCTLNVEYYYQYFQSHHLFPPDSDSSEAMGQMVDQLKLMGINRIPSALLHDVSTTLAAGCNTLPNGMSCFQEGQWLNASYMNGTAAGRQQHAEACAAAAGTRTDPAMQECVCTYEHIADLYNAMAENPDNRYCNGNVRSTTPAPADDICVGMNWNQIENYTMTNCNQTVRNAFVNPDCSAYMACDHASGQCVAQIIALIQAYNNPDLGGNPNSGGGGGGGGSSSTTTTVYVIVGCVMAVVVVGTVVGYVVRDRRLGRGGIRRAGPRYVQIDHAQIDHTLAQAEDVDEFESDSEDL